MRYYSVTCMRGHCGDQRYIPITFAIMSENAVEAMEKAKAMPGVKHDRPVLKLTEITCKQYYIMRQRSAYERAESIR